MKKNIYTIQEAFKRISKKSLLFYFVFFTFGATLSFLYTHTRSNIKAKKSRVNTQSQDTIKTIAWDLHDVVFYGKPSIMHALWNYKKKSKLIPRGKVARLLWNYITGKEKHLNATLLIKTARTHHYDDLAEFIISNESDCKPADEIVDVIKKLHEQGYTQYVCSNISSYGLERLKEKYPELFSYFNGAYTTQENNLYKPHAKFFNMFLTEYKLNPKNILFIDDKKKNCLGAEKLGIHTLWFKGKSKKDRQKSIKRIYADLLIDAQKNSLLPLAQ